MKHNNLAIINMTVIFELRIRTYFGKSYEHAIELFLTTYPDGSIRKRSWRLDGSSYPEKRKSTHGNVIDVEQINEIDLRDISDDEWSESSTEDDE